MDWIMRHPISRKLNARSITWISRLDARMIDILIAWVVGAGLACALQILVAFSASSAIDPAPNMLSYWLIVATPVTAILFALRRYPTGMLFARPDFHLARIGRWQRVDAVTARSLPLFGASGFMVSLIIGIFLNVPVRAAEFLTAIPAVPAAAPLWFLALRSLMLGDLLVMSAIYCVAAVMAIRHVPLFPRFLAMAWGVDILIQLTIARVMGGIASLPPDVAHALGTMLTGNVKKVLISAMIWLPYLILSRRVNLTYRWRVPAAA